MLEATDYTVVFLRDEMIERVSRSRVMPAPKPEKNNEAKIDEQSDALSSKKISPEKDRAQDNNDSADKAWRSTDNSGEARKFTIDKLVDNEKDRKGFKIRLFGCTEAADTCQDAKQLPYNKIVNISTLKGREFSPN